MYRVRVRMRAPGASVRATADTRYVVVGNDDDTSPLDPRARQRERPTGIAAQHQQLLRLRLARPARIERRDDERNTRPAQHADQMTGGAPVPRDNHMV